MQVPVYQRQVQQQGLPNARENIQVDASNFLGDTEAAALKYGENALDNVNKAVQHHYAQQLYEAQKTRVLDAATQFQAHVQDAMYGKNGFLNKTGSSAFLGSDGKSASDLLFDDAIAKQDAIADTLGNDEQKAMFKQSTNSMLMTMRGQAMGHEAQQHRVYTQSTLESSNDVQSNQIQLNYNNPDLMKQSIAQIKANNAQLAQLHGYDSIWGATNAQGIISKALNSSIDVAINNNDHGTALKIIHDLAPEMNQNDLLTNFQKINKVQSVQSAITAATTAMTNAAPQFNPQDGDRLNNLVIGTESTHQHWQANGQLTTSPEGAIGKWQVMPKTAPEAAKLAGLDWNPKLFYQVKTGDSLQDAKAEQYNEALGKAYLQKQIQNNDGNIEKGLAAYNAGPGALKNALDKADKEGGNWLSYLPKETQNYVTNISTQYRAGMGKPPEPTLEEVQAHALSLVPPNDLDARQAALQEVTRQYTVHQQAIKEHNDYNTGQAILALSKNGGNFLALPQNMRDAIPPEDLSKVQSFAKSQQEGKRESNKALYNHLTSNPSDLASLSEDQLLKLAPELSDADFKHFSAQRASLLKPEAGNSPNVLDTDAINIYLNNLLDIQKIPTTGKDADPEQLGAIRKFVNDSLLSSQAQTGKKFTDAEVSSKINELFAKNVQFRKTFLGFTTGISNRQVIAANVDDIDKNTVAQIKEQFGKRGIDNPTNGQILGAYFNGMSK